MKIVADDKIPFLKGVLEPFAEVLYLPGDKINSRQIKSADILLTRSITTCNRELLQGSAIQIIATATIGTDHIDLGYCAGAGIRVYHAKGCNAPAVEQYITTVLLALAGDQEFPLEGKTLGIIGVGSVGSRVHRAAEALGLRVLLNDPPRAAIEGRDGFVSLGKIKEEADFVSLHVPLTKTGEYPTYHLADEGFFRGFKKPICFINSSRGDVVDEDALLSAIQSGDVKRAVLDVFEHEPQIDKILLTKLFLATPHIAGYSLQGKARGTAMIVQALSRQLGWKLDNWTPETKEPRSIELDCGKMSKQKALQEIFNKVYPIREDDRLLKDNPENFEELRRDYHLRNDNAAIHLKVVNAGQSLLDSLNQLNFKRSKNNQ